MRSKREKRLRAIRREIVEPFYEKKEAAKLAAQEAALSAPKLPVRTSTNNTSASMDVSSSLPPSSSTLSMDIDMADNNKGMGLKPVGKKMKKKLKIAKGKKRGKGKIRRKHI